MNVYERIRKTLDHEEPDRVPTFTQSAEPEFISKYIKNYGRDSGSFFLTRQLKIARHVGFDSMWMHIGAAINNPFRIKPSIPDEYKPKDKSISYSKEGHLWKKSSDGRIWYYGGLLKTPELIETWAEFIRESPKLPNFYYRTVKWYWDYGIKKRLLPIPTLGAPFYFSWAAIGLDRLAYIMRKYPNSLHKLMDAWTTATVEDQILLFEKGVDMVFICDDHAQKERPMISLKQFEEFVYPYYKRLADNANKYDAKLILHTDGNIEQEIPLIIKAGIHAIEPLEYEAGMRVGTVKQKYGDTIAIIGNVPASDALSVGTVEDTIRITKECIHDGAPGGGYILGTGADLLGSIQPQNLKAMIETARKYGSYPIS
ncbi:MAG: hypothetical protein EU530_04740 [Promethearchaeota archaeon]|nr:MAG: hypothetical protein EU530_04740 [Candidatus Lokiarchaeota archaeon]